MLKPSAIIRQVAVMAVSAAFLPSIQAPTYTPVRVVTAPSYVVSALARSIARHEGADALGGLPQRLNNPGGLRYAGQLGAMRDSSGYAHFSSQELGYRALRRQIEVRFARGMALGDVLKIWAEGAYLGAVLDETGLAEGVKIP